MRTLNLQHVEAIEELDAAALTCVSGGRIDLELTPHAPLDEPGGGVLGLPYALTKGAMRFGAGPWDYGYGSPTGPWPV